ncbi:MAG: hypothetical protein QM308_07615 [Bacillota bacterium]|nr:hypothetical protein [Bacillota bacterium]
MRLIRRLWILALALLCLLSSASAQPLTAVKPLFTTLSSGDPYALHIRAELLHWPDLAKESLAALKSWLLDAELSLLAHEKAGESALILNHGDKPLLSLYLEQTGDAGRMLVSSGDQGAFTAYSSASSLPWQALLGAGPALPRPDKARDALSAFADAALPVLQPYEKAVKTSISIKNVGKGASQLVYSLNKQEAQQVFEDSKARLLPLLDEALTALLPASAQQISAAFSSLEAAGALTLKRFLTKEGEDLGLQLTGAFKMSGAARKLTLFYGHSDTGFYLSFKFPASKGRDTLEFQTALRFQEDSLLGDWKYKTVSGKNTETLTGEINLKTLPEAEGHRLSGGITSTLKTAGEEKASFTYSLTPDFRLQGADLEGNLRLEQSSGKTPLYGLILNFSGRPAQALAIPPSMAEVDLDSATREEVDLAAMNVKTLLLARLKSFLLALPQEARLLLLHDLGRDRRTDGQTVAPIDTDRLFTVDEETTPPPTKEETP